jgi:Zn-dependent protease with chaperone function
MADLAAPSARKRSIARRALLAFLLTIGFYALALLMMGILLLVPFLEIRTGHLHIQLLLVCVIGFFAILFAILPHGDEFKTPWPRITADEHPRLFEKIEHIAARANQRMPDEVYLLPDLNAWVADRGGRFGGSRRVMGIGLPLLQVLDVSQFTAVIAHEFGHYYGGDTRLGPWIHKTRVTIGRTMKNLSESSASIVQGPFNAYAKMFLRVTQGVSREQEYTADRFAASIAGREPVASSLKRLAGYDPGVAIFWHRLLIPTLFSGFRPPITEGMAQMVASEQITKAATDYAETVLKEAGEDPFDTHPCLRDRVAALEDLPAGEAGDTTSALSLLDDIRGVEDKILGMYMPGKAIAKLEEIEWDDVAERVFLTAWIKLRECNRSILSSWTTEELPAMIEKASEIAPGLFDVSGRHVLPEGWPSLFIGTVRAALALALRDAGWTLVAKPDFGCNFVRGDKHVDPDEVVAALARRQGDPAEWARACTQAGIYGMLLSGGMAPAVREPRRSAVQIVPSTPAPPGVSFEPGEGETIETAIVIHNARSQRVRTEAEFAWLTSAFGAVREDWTMVDHSNHVHNGRSIDRAEIELRGGQRRIIYFDITE